jgi:hypothetical protein
VSEQLEFVEFVWLPTFERTARGLLTEADRRRLEMALVKDPEVGDLIPGTGGFRKMRWAARGKGKSGGARVIYFYVARRATIYVVLAYGKGVRADLTDAERTELKKMAESIKQGRS